jgi:hypothetical protein
MRTRKILRLELNPRPPRLSLGKCNHTICSMGLLNQTPLQATPLEAISR